MKEARVLQEELRGPGNKGGETVINFGAQVTVRYSPGSLLSPSRISADPAFAY